MTRMNRDGTGPQPSRVPQGLDEVLNIFALANSVDLIHGEGRDRVLEWYRDRGTRRIHLMCGDASSFDLDIAAEFSGGGARHEVRERFRTGVAAGEIKGLLVEAIDAANALVARGESET